MSVTPTQEGEPRSRLDQFVDDVIVPIGASERTIEAFRRVDRAAFAGPEQADLAYQDMIIPLIDGRSTISMPSLVAVMIEMADVQDDHTVLEVGTATGYQAALLSHLAKSVHTIEVDERLAKKAADILEKLETAHKISVSAGDGGKGAPFGAPFDRIIVTAGLRDVPPPLMEQLAVGGHLIAPIGEFPDNSKLVLVHKLSETESERHELIDCQFVPFFSPVEGAWTEEAFKEATDKRNQEREEKAEQLYRAPLRSYLTEIYAKGGVSYEALMARVQQEMAILLNLRRPLTEAEMLDALAYSDTVLQPPKPTDANEAPLAAQIVRPKTTPDEPAEE